ncbi:hypothetical protein CWB55_09055 [Staphylococcus hominis]|uniref:hypothetical protein n=1 Tax=Staphylococcus hominis TaxID=1290 RepID=UPI000C257CC4|nr:hypothetical protein [Staphylococcus hominis]PJM55770.1 hypothetical protein CWB55_09055 [Staphylococcus hominis]
MADESPQAQEIQEAKAETIVKENNYFNNEHNSAEEIVAQQNAIKAELSNNLADESPQAQEIQEAKKRSKLLKMKNKKKQMHLQHNVEQFNQKHQVI